MNSKFNLELFKGVINLSLEWSEIEIGNLGKIVTGKTPRTAIEDNYGGDILFLTPSDNMDVKYVYKTKKTLTKKGLNEVKNCLIPKNSVCVSCIGTVGNVVLTTEETITNQQINSIIVNDNFDNDFVYYLMVLVGKRLYYLSQTSSVVPIINKSTFSKELVKVPPLDSQKKISSILSTIDNKIEKLQNINNKLQLLSKNIFKYYMEDFVPFLKNGVKSTELGDIPKDWNVCTFDSITNIYNGYSYKGNELQPSNSAMVTIKNFNRDGTFRVDGFKEIVYSDKIKEHHFVNENDVLISCTDVTQDADIIGNCVVLLDNQSYSEIIMSMDLVKVESNIDEINNFLLATILKSYRFKMHILGYVNGTTVLHLDKKGIKKFKLALPDDLSILNNLSAIMEDIYNQISINMKEINNLTKLRDTLLPKLMSGEIDVSKIRL